MSGSIVLNPEIFKDKRDALAVCWDEALRLFMEDTGFEPKFEVPQEQLDFFATTEYASDEAAMRKTIVARIATFDTSIPNPTPEQVSETIRLLDSAIGVFKGQPDGNVLQRMRDELEKSNKDIKSPVAQSPTLPGGNNQAEPSPEAGEVPAQEQEATAPEEAIGAETAPNSPKEAQSDMGGGDVQAAVSDYIARIKPVEMPEFVAKPQSDMDNTVERVLNALPAAELPNRNPWKVGDSGRAVGMYQEWPIFVDNANRLAGKTVWSYEDRNNQAAARAMAKIQLEHQYRRGVTDPVALGGTHRNPKGDAPQWYLNRLRKRLAEDE